MVLLINYKSMTRADLARDTASLQHAHVKMNHMPHEDVLLNICSPRTV